MASSNVTIQQFELFHDSSQAWTAKINDRQVPCVGLALIDGKVQGLVSPTQLQTSGLDKMADSQSGWLPANTVDGFQGYYEPSYTGQQAGRAMRESVTT